MRAYAVVAGTALLIGAARVPGEAAPAPFETLRLSAEVARAGEVARDPWLLIAAARLRAGAEVQPDADAAARTSEWLARVEALGGDDARVVSVVADMKAHRFKGCTAGPRVTQTLLRDGERRSFSETFRVGRPGVVYVEGDGDTDLTLNVGAACHDVQPGDVKICSWMPARSEKVTVEIGNS